MKNYLTLLLFIVTTSIISQNTLKLGDKISPNASINDVSWITGYWEGEALGGITEEIWTAPLGKSMMGSFKLVVEDTVQFYELCTITEENNSLLLRIKHFDKNLNGWEEKDTSIEFPLVKIEKNKVYFDDLTFEKISENELVIYVIFKEEGKDEIEMKFNYKLAK
ncbi:DUF6265 family protein [Lutibacter sp. A64]|uniref:DUF6265 family protein n=1 Tax=Lutibacter sp. A64 TaxID=2918526 RepID=UPI001F064188|nr:DUF6265 family protein [Lutibacter sp. A64]UMB54741.1 DUF6265 family protein [Lutibacter sp. A64]